MVEVGCGNLKVERKKKLLSCSIWIRINVYVYVVFLVKFIYIGLVIKKKILYIVFILRFVYFDVNYKNVYVLIYDGIYYKEFKNFYFLLIYNIVYW